MKSKQKDEKTVVNFWKDLLESIIGFENFQTKKNKERKEKKKKYSAFVMSSIDSEL